MQRYASLSLDLDNLWSYLKIHGDASWETFPSYLDRFAERFQQFIAPRDLRVTIFTVGQDAALPQNRNAFRLLARGGHEFGNHSFHHEPWIARANFSDARAELERAHAAIAAATACEPDGFRGPGFATSPALLEALAAMNYRYDASTLATFIGPLARAYYFRNAKLSEAQRRERAELFGAFRDGLKSNKMHYTPQGLVEIPVTVMPGFRLPMHCSYLHYLDAVSPAMADAYWSFALTLCDWTATVPSLLLHPLDFLGADDVPELAFFPAMHRSGSEKLAATARFIDAFVKRYTVVTLREHAGLVTGGLYREIA